MEEEAEEYTSGIVPPMHKPRIPGGILKKPAVDILPYERKEVRWNAPSPEAKPSKSKVIVLPYTSGGGGDGDGLGGFGGGSGGLGGLGGLVGYGSDTDDDDDGDDGGNTQVRTLSLEQGASTRSGPPLPFWVAQGDRREPKPKKKRNKFFTDD